MNKLRVLDLFSGIGGFSLGLERAGMQTVAFCEIDPFCRRVLNKHWPEVPIYEDVRELTAERLSADGISVDVICGGFPCQDISTAGKGVGIEGERSGLWREYARIISEIRPAYVIVENVAALLGRGLDRVLGDLSEIGFDAEWHCIPASAVGAPHRRDRVWIVANPYSGRRRTDATGRHDANWQDAGRSKANGMPGTVCAPGASGAVAFAKSKRLREARQLHQRSAERPSSSGEILGNANGERREGSRCDVSRGWGELAATDLGVNGQWQIESGLGRVVDGIPNWAHRLRALGNAVVPQIPEIIGRAIIIQAEAV